MTHKDPFPNIPEGWERSAEPPSRWDIEHGIAPIAALLGPEHLGELGMVAYDEDRGGYFLPGASGPLQGPFSTLDEAIRAAEKTSA